MATNVPRLIAAWPHPSAFEAPAGTSASMTQKASSRPHRQSVREYAVRLRVSWPGKLNDPTESFGGCSVRHIQLLQACGLALSVLTNQPLQNSPCICDMHACLSCLHACMYDKTLNHAHFFAASFETAGPRCDAVKSAGSCPKASWCLWAFSGSGGWGLALHVGLLMDLWTATGAGALPDGSAWEACVLSVHGSHGHGCHTWAWTQTGRGPLREEWRWKGRGNRQMCMFAGVAISAPSRLLEEPADLLGHAGISHARISIKALGCLGLVELWPR